MQHAILRYGDCMNTFCVALSKIKLSTFPVVNKNDSIEYAYDVMKKHGLDRAVVVGPNEKITGIITKKDIMKKLALTRTIKIDIGRLHVSSFMTSDPYILPENSNAVYASHLMHTRNIGSLPVIDDKDKLSGLVTRREISSLATNSVGIMIKKLIKPVPAVLTTDDKVINARHLFLQHDVLIFPVVSDEKLVGAVTINEVADALFLLQYQVDDKFRDRRLNQLRIGEIMKEDIPTALPEDELDTVVKKILEKKTVGAIVVEDEKPIGIVSFKEIIELISNQKCP
jgi:CBS domain-containing protein